MSNEYVMEGLANLFKGKEAVGGKLYLSEEELNHHPHKLNVQKGDTTIRLEEVSEIESKKSFKVLNNVMIVKTVSGEEHKFVVNKRNKWVDKINSLRERSETTTGV
ncbi:hypothetical protein CEY16_11590 [Halalkalibacillus sediminis]|uniref:GRAM domain-containing protein n=1 Tax=Halalkalibacillus sediminis TaxID=2018042 RepID=A0A2I0QSN4_9BACI|nr:hypothetical protein [Halalkalibacillus sediminis]PKR77365.1 hypothetical protein CEY16_11590 [Halalkalibacillus sediminis]